VKIGIDLSIIQADRAGTGQYARELFNGIAALDTPHQFVTFSSSIGRSLGQRRTVSTRFQTLYHDLVWRHMVLPWRAARSHVEVLHSPDFISPVVASMPTIVSILDVTVLKMPESFPVWFRNYARVFLPWSAKRAGLILTISEASKQEIAATIHVDPGKIVVTHLAAGPVFRQVSTDKISAIKLKYGLSNYILHVCTLEPRKNTLRLIQALAQMRDAGLVHQLVHVGAQGWLYDEVLAEVDRLDLAGSVRFLGHVPQEDLVALYNGAEVFAYPSLYEGFGLPVLEAMQCGCPVLTSNRSSLPEVAGDAAVLVDPENVSAMAQSLARLLTNSTLADDYRQRGLERARLFSWQRCASETLQAYERCLGIKNTSSG
jgi:glycosyltransferase involved in cell wall biosynthesis